jgi:integrase
VAVERRDGRIIDRAVLTIEHDATVAQSDDTTPVVPGEVELVQCADERQSVLVDDAPQEIHDFSARTRIQRRDGFVSKGNARRYIAEQVGKIVRIIEHAVSRELVAPDRIVALRALPALKRGQAKESQRKAAVTLETIRATLPHLTDTAAAMVRLQLATAMRPSEMFAMRPIDVDRSGTTWIYKPVHHKTERHDKARSIPILGEALAALTPFMFGDPEELCFLTTKGTCWNKDSYRIAIARAAKAAKCPHWTPYGLRHACAQAVRDSAGPEAVQALLGHARLNMVETYSRASEAKAIEGAKHAPRLAVNAG